MERFSKLTFLGTSSAAPTKTRNVSCATVTLLTGDVWMFDCGEGTQHQVNHSAIKTSKINKIFITHLHGDHCFGLPGLLCSMSQAKCKVGAFDPENPYAVLDTNPSKKTYTLLDAPDKPPNKETPIVDIYGPYQLGAYIRNALTMSASYLSFSLRVHEAVPDYVTDQQLNEYQKQTSHFNELKPRWLRLSTDQHCFPLVQRSPTQCGVRAAPLDHGDRIYCIGYSLTEPDTSGTLQTQKLTAMGVPKGPLWGQLKSGKSVTLENGTQVNPQDAMGETICGRTLVILGDTCDSTQMIPIAQGAEWIVHEATYDDSMTEFAKPRGHSTARMAGEFAAKIEASNLILTHFSARYTSSSKDRKKSTPSTTTTITEPSLSSAQQTGCDHDENPKPAKMKKTDQPSTTPADQTVKALVERWPDLLTHLQERKEGDRAIVEPLLQQAKEGFQKSNVIAAEDFMELDLSLSKRKSELTKPELKLGSETNHSQDKIPPPPSSLKGT